MKKTLTISLVFAAITFSASAQQNEKETLFGKKENHQRNFHNDAMNDLNLTDDQKAQLKTIREDQSLTREARREKMNNILTDEQKAKMAKNRTAMHSQGNQVYQKGDDQVQQNKTEMKNLTDDQAAKLKSIKEDARSQMKAVNVDKTLTKEERIEKLKTIKKSADEQRKSIFTPTQDKKIIKAKKINRSKYIKAKKTVQ